MKKTFTFALLCAETFSLTAITTKVKVAYFNSTYRDYKAVRLITAPVHPVLALLRADPNFEVT
jgi:uncharacterized membrane protein